MLPNQRWRAHQAVVRQAILIALHTLNLAITF